MKVSQITYDNLNEDIIDKILFNGIEDENRIGDCILVLGSSSANKYRIPKAVSVYNDERSKKIILSGGRILNFEYG